jgi:hypothetical protein
VKASFSALFSNYLIYFLYIWSDYGDEIIVDKGTTLSKWCPAGKVSQRLSVRERGQSQLKDKKRKKSNPKNNTPKVSKKLLSRDSEVQLALKAMSDGFSQPTGRN